MKFLLYIGISIIAYSYFVSGYNVNNQIKVVKVQLLAINSEYFNVNTHKLEVTTVNETYNALDLDLIVIKDFPSDADLICDIFRSNIDSKNYQEIHKHRMSICRDDNSGYQQYLPDILRQLLEAGKCVPKGHYLLDDVQYYPFWNSLSEQEINNSRFKALTSLKSGNTELLTMELDFVPSNC